MGKITNINKNPEKQIEKEKGISSNLKDTMINALNTLTLEIKRIQNRIM